MSDHDPFDDSFHDHGDDQLGAALRRRATGSPLPTAAAHERVVRRAGTIRRRRAAIGGGGAMAVLLVGGVLMLPRGAEEQVPAVTGDVLPSFDDRSTLDTTTIPGDDPVDEAAPRSVDLPIPSVSDVSTSSPSTTASTVPRSLPSTSVAPSTSAPSSSTPTSTASTTETTSDTIGDTTAETSPALAPFTDTYQSAGGSISVSWNGSALSLQAASPAPGYAAEVEDASATRVRVRFRSDAGDSRIEVRIVGAQVLVDID